MRLPVRGNKRTQCNILCSLSTGNKRHNQNRRQSGLNVWLPHPRWWLCLIPAWVWSHRLCHHQFCVIMPEDWAPRFASFVVFVWWLTRRGHICLSEPILLSCGRRHICGPCGRRRGALLLHEHLSLRVKKPQEEKEAWENMDRTVASEVASIKHPWSHIFTKDCTIGLACLHPHLWCSR